MAACFIAFWAIFLFSPQLSLHLLTLYPKGKQENLVQPNFFFFHLEFNFLTTLPHLPKMTMSTFLMLYFTLLERKGRKNMHVRDWCSFCYNFIWDSSFFQPVCLAMQT